MKPQRQRRRGRNRTIIVERRSTVGEDISLALVVMTVWIFGFLCGRNFYFINDIFIGILEQWAGAFGSSPC